MFDRWYLPEDLCSLAASRYPSLADLLTPTILHELHALLWTPPRPGDHGWNCRDHALVVGGFLAVRDVRVALRQGSCMFVLGSAEGLPPVGLGEESPKDRRRGLPSATHPANWGHTWLKVEGVGDLDVSARLDVREGNWRPMKHLGIVGDEWWMVDGGDLLVCHSQEAYVRAWAEASYLEDAARAIYLVEHEQQLDPSAFEDSFGWAYSPLSDTLKKRGRRPSAYLKLIDHLVALSKDESRPLVNVSWNRAWEIIDGRSDDGARDVEASLKLG